MARNPESSRRGARTSLWARIPYAGPALTILLAVLVGTLVLPRFGQRLEGGAVPDLALPVIFGGEPGARVRLSEQQGKFVLLDFWASYCVPCRQQSQVLEAIRRRMPDVVVIGVHVGETPELAQSYLAASKPSYLVVEDAEEAASAAFRVDALPTLVAIDKKGHVFAVRRHFVPERELSALLEAMRGS